MSNLDQKTVRRRRVFYIPGYDPIPPRRYRELYRSEAAAQAKISDYSVDLSPRPAGDRYGWSVTGRIEGATTVADFDVLVWSDIVQSSMRQGIFATYLQLVRTVWIYVASGAFLRLMRLRKGPIIAALYPIVMLLLQLTAALLVAGLAGAGLALTGLPYAGWLGLLLVWPVLAWFRRMDGKLYAYYLMHDYAFSARARGAYPPELEARMAEFRAAITEALQSDVDEVLVVGHSSGAHLGVSILSDILRSGRRPAERPALSFLSLGQVVPMVSFLPDADRLRADLHFLSAREDIVWVDVTAPGDGCAFALCDPVSVTGVAPEGKIWPLVISAAFSQTLGPERWAALRWRFFRLHFQYLCAFDRPGDYDYFKITAGPRTLGERFAGRKPSQSRIEAPASRYRSMAA